METTTQKLLPHLIQSLYLSTQRITNLISSLIERDGEEVEVEETEARVLEAEVVAEEAIIIKNSTTINPNLTLSNTRITNGKETTL